jgi:peroxiredoxin
MSISKNPNLQDVDWSTIPAPIDDGGIRHLTGISLPEISLPATDGSIVCLAKRAGRTVVFAYPRTGEPGKIGLVDDWDQIPGARGCTPQSCAFRDLHQALVGAGASAVFGLSTQTTTYQREMVQRLHLPFAVLSDSDLALTSALRLPTHLVAGETLIKRMAWIIDAGRITQVFYPVFPPDRNARDVLAWLEAHPRA